MHYCLKIFALCFVGILIALTSASQPFQRIYDYNFTTGQGLLENPLAGGMNSCQISHLDVNMDGKKDLFLFDKSNARISIYLNMDDTPGTINYKYTAEYNSIFPSGLRNWVFMRDLNCDGKEDLLFNSGGGFRVYWNTSTTSLSFASTPTSPIQASYELIPGSTFLSNVYSVAPDISAFEDIDNDGDMDIITWTESAGSLYLYINMAVENGDCSQPEFVCKGMCYAMLNEAPDSFEIMIGNAFECSNDVVNPRSDMDESIELNERMHVGGTLMVVDLDQNGKKDLIIGDVGNPNLVAIPITTASNGRDSAMAVIDNFPSTYSNTTAVNLKLFPAAFYLDINNDGVKDLVVGSNAYADSEDRHSFWLYLNRGLDDLPDFEYVEDNFLQGGQIDLGTGAFPVVFDVDGDGKKDLLISNIKYYDGINNLTSVIHYYRNNGTINAPSFELVDDNWLNLAMHGWHSAYPAFGDLDGDGDMDLIVGDQDGKLHRFTNTAGSGVSPQFELTEEFLTDNQLNIIDVGQFSVPQILDLNEDGLSDLIIGEYNGNINYYQNVGTASQHSFQHMADTLGGVLATSILGIQGKSVPHFFKNAQNQWELLLGTEVGEINHYRNISGNLNGSFELITNRFENLYDGARSAPFLADINGDNRAELFIGNLSGGISIYQGLAVSIDEHHVNHSFQCYPNPTTANVTIAFPWDAHETATIELYDVLGKLVMSTQTQLQRVTLNTSDYPSGMYLLRVQSPKFNGTQRLIIRKDH